MSEETEPRQFTYDAFATYATDPDRDLVRDIEDFIESLHRNRLLSKQFREKHAICVDGQDFRIPRPEAANPKTLAQIMRDVVRTCQATSRCLLVFSGSSTTSHPWINAEINWWREQPGFGPIFFILTHGQVSENAKQKLGDDAGQKNSVSESLPNALALDRAGLSELWFDLRGHYVRARWRCFRRSLLDRKLSAESSNWNKVRNYSEERFRLATQILALRLKKDLSKEDVLPKWNAAWRLKQRLRRVQLGIGVVLLFVAAMLADRVIEGQRIEELTTVAQAAVNDQEYERAIKTAQVFLGHTYDVNSARLSSDGKRLVTASSDRTVRIWDVETGVSMLKFSVGREANDAFYVNDDSQIIVTAASGDILIYDVSWTRKLNRELKVRACAEKLLDLDDSSECSRTGAFSRKFWQQLF